MRARVLLSCLLVACGTSDLTGGNSGAQDPVKGDRDGGALIDDDDQDDADDDDDVTTPDAGAPEEPGRDEEDAGTSDAAIGDGGASDPIEDILNDLAELTTCKPSQLNPVGECINVTCENSDSLAAAVCIFEQCGSLIQAVDPKCAECVIAAVSQDTLGLLNCIDGQAVVGSL